MKLTVFKNLINNADDAVALGINYDGVCCILDRTFEEKAISDFQKWFRPRYGLTKYGTWKKGFDGQKNFWLGDFYSKESLQRRHFYLRMFEQLAIAEKLYEKY